jgi:hypothetical protein
VNKDLGAWIAEDCAMVLIDYQNEMFEDIRSETRADLAELNVRLSAKTAKAFDMPIVLFTVGVDYKLNGPTLPSIVSELEGIEPLDHTSMNASRIRPPARRCERPGRNDCSSAGSTPNSALPWPLSRHSRTATR